MEAIKDCIAEIHVFAFIETFSTWPSCGIISSFGSIPCGTTRLQFCCRIRYQKKQTENGRAQHRLHVMRETQISSDLHRDEVSTCLCRYIRPDIMSRAEISKQGRVLLQQINSDVSTVQKIQHSAKTLLASKNGYVEYGEMNL